MSKRRHNFGTKRFKEKSHFIFHARIALKSLIPLFVRLIVRGARIGKTQTHRHTDRTSTVTLVHARRGLIIIKTLYGYIVCTNLSPYPPKTNQIINIIIYVCMYNMYSIMYNMYSINVQHVQYQCTTCTVSMYNMYSIMYNIYSINVQHVQYHVQHVQYQSHCSNNLPDKK